MRTTFSEADHAAVTRAVAAAEAGTSGEIVTVVAARSDRYHDVALAWAAAFTLLALALCAAWPWLLTAPVDALLGGWTEPWTPARLLAWTLVVLSAKFIVWRLILAWMPLRDLLTPRAVKTRRVRARALDYFRIGAERRTAGRTGILIFLSLAEHRAEIVADAAIHTRVPPEAWGAAMAALVDEVKAGRAGGGLVACIGAVGAILAEQLPRSGDDANELPDRLIEL